MIQIIENLTRKPELGSRYAEVVRPVGGNRYQVIDRAGRQFVVDSDRHWTVGFGVSVSQGRIVGAATKFKNPKVYEV